MDSKQIVRIFPIPTPIQIHPLAGGANNRVYKLEFDNHPPLVLKEYFQDAKDQRPRLQSEFSFLQYAWNIGLRVVPQPFFSSAEANAAIYSYIPAFSVHSSDIDNDLVTQKIAFFLRLNERKKDALHLLPASEACFTPDEYLQITENRILRLYQGSPETFIEKELRDFLNQQLLPKWNQLKTQCKAALHDPIGQKIAIENQCISPSDFGFHNALIQNKQLTFIDFEYAGWDDPCKTVCDLFCQPKIPLPQCYFEQVLNSFSQCVLDSENFLRRVELLYPIVQMKWCCIILNAFTKVGKTRRQFSYSDEMEHLEKQLALAKKRLQQI